MLGIEQQSAIQAAELLMEWSQSKRAYHISSANCADRCRGCWPPGQAFGQSWPNMTTC